MKTTKQQLKQIIKEELRDYYGGESHSQSERDAAQPRRPDNMTDDERNPINIGDTLQIVDSDAGYLVLNVSKVKGYNMDVDPDNNNRMLVRVLEFKDPTA